MKKIFPTLYKILLLVSIYYLYVSFSFAPPAGLTGAPGEATCGNCHFGATQTGNIDITGILDVDNPIIPDKTYNVTISINLTSGSSSRAGFQFVALDGNSAGSPSTGAFSNLGTNVGTAASGNRTYALHTGGENTYVGSNVTYTFDWTAPSTSTNDISFYATGLIANGSGINGDLVVFDSDQNIVLPVDLVEFEARALTSNEVVLRWTTLSEQNSYYFEILRSDNGQDFDPIGRIEAAQNASTEIDYRYVDKNPILNRTSFYRLKMVDLDGLYEYSDIVAVQNISKEESLLNLFPNPARKDFCLFVDYVSDVDRPNAVVRIYDLEGNKHLSDPQMEAGITKGFNKLVLDINTLHSGQYFLCVSDGDKMLHTKTFIVAQ